MTVYLIAAVAENRAIGKDNDLLWNLPDDMLHFKRSTTGATVITGRRSYESIPAKYRPLPGRRNVVVTRNPNYQAPGADVVHSLKAALHDADARGEREVYIIGGGSLYAEALRADVVDVMLLTRVHATFEADVFFPEFDAENWVLAGQQGHPKDEKHAYAFTYETLLRKRG